MFNRILLGLVLAAPIAVMAQAPKSISEDSLRYGQSIADAMKAAAGTDAAFLPAGMLKSSLAGKDLASALEFPSEELAVVKLTGAQVKQALERAVSLYPTQSPGFLHVSGMEVTFSPSASPDKRVTSVQINGAALNPGSTYRIAAPASLARGGLGYFTVWQKTAVEASSKAKSLESFLKGVQPNSSGSRWKAAAAEQTE